MMEKNKILKFDMPEKYRILAIQTNVPTGIFKLNGEYHFSIIDKVRDNDEGYHLYVISNDEINKNDLCVINYEYNGKYVSRAKHLTPSKLFMCTEDNYELMTNRCKKIIAATDKSLKLPLLDNESIDFFIKNQGNIKDFEIEHEMTEGWIPTYNNPDNINLDPPAEPTGFIKIITK